MTLLLLLAQTRARCTCADATRVELWGLSLPVGPATGVFALALLLFLPPMLYGWVQRRREAEAMRRVLAPTER